MESTVLSKTERDYLSGKLTMSKSYERVLKYRIKIKLKQFFMLELPLIQKSGITEFYNAITENNNAEIMNPLNYECGRRDLNPGNGLGRPVY